MRSYRRPTQLARFEAMTAAASDGATDSILPGSLDAPAAVLAGDAVASDHLPVTTRR